MATTKKPATKTATPKRIPNPGEVRIMFRLPDDVHEMLKALSKDETRSLNSMVVELIKRAHKS